MDDRRGTLEIPIAVFKSHRIKLDHGHALLKKWGIDLKMAGIPLTNEPRESLWYVGWDEKKQEFKRNFRVLEIGAFPKMGVLQELMRQGLNKMQELQGTYFA